MLAMTPCGGSVVLARAPQLPDRGQDARATVSGANGVIISPAPRPAKDLSDGKDRRPDVADSRPLRSMGVPPMSSTGILSVSSMGILPMSSTGVPPVSSMGVPPVKQGRDGPATRGRSRLVALHVPACCRGWHRQAPKTPRDAATRRSYAVRSSAFRRVQQSEHSSSSVSIEDGAGCAERLSNPPNES